MQHYNTKFYTVRHIKSGMHLSHNGKAMTQNINEMFTALSKSDAVVFRKLRPDPEHFVVVTWTMDWELP